MTDRTSLLDGALPLPPQDTGALGEAIRSLEPVRQQATRALTQQPPSSWHADSRTAAAREVATAQRIAAEAASRADVARGAVAEYLNAVLNTRGTVLRLHEEWERGARRRDRDMHRVAGLDLTELAMHERRVERAWADVQADTRRAHAQAVRELAAAGQRCAGLLLRCAAELPGADPRSTRSTVLAELPIMSALVGQAEAKRIVDDLVRQVGLPPGDWAADPARVRAVLPSLVDTVRDPFVASELMSRMTPDQLYRLVQHLQATAVSRSDERERAAAVAALRTLGVAFSTAANPLYAASRADQAQRELAARRVDWLRQLAGTGARLLDEGTKGARFTGIDAQGILIRLGAEAGVVPGREYAAALAPVFAAVDSIRMPAPRHPWVVGPLDPLDVREDPMLDLLGALRGDVDAIRAALTAPWRSTDPGKQTRVLDYLVAERPLSHRVDPTFNTTLAEVVRQATTGNSHEAALVASQLFRALASGAGHAGQDTTSASAKVLRQGNMDELRRLAAALLREHPQIVADVIMRIAALDTDEVEPRADGSGYAPTIRSRADLAAVLGDIGLTGVTAGSKTADGVQTRELAEVLAAVAAYEAAALAAALAAKQALGAQATDQDRYRVSQEVQRLAQAMGFCAEVAGRGSVALHTVSDEQNTRTRQIYAMVIGKVELPPTAKASLPGWAAELAVKLAQTGLTAIVESAYPIDAAAAAADRAEHNKAVLEDHARLLAWDLMAATRQGSDLPTLAHSPYDTDASRFWDPATGRLLSARELTDPSDPHHNTRLLAAQRWAKASAPELQVLQNTILDEIRSGVQTAGRPRTSENGG